jgi:hypothetical protein
MLDQESYYARNKWGTMNLPPYRDLRKEPVRKPSRWPMFAICGVAMMLVLVAVVAPV